jgi:formamidopyrimidine-DNA glycosylase
MPELPDITVYLEALGSRVRGEQLQSIRLGNPFVLRSVDPPIHAASERTVSGLEGIGKRIVLALDGEYFVLIHLMIAGRLRWRPPGAKVPKGRGLAAFDFEHGTLLLTEEGKKRRASLHLVQGRETLAEFDAGGLDVFQIDLATFAERLTLSNHTLKRALTDPEILSGIGNAYSDEVLHAARLSPLTLTSRLDDAQIARLFEATRATLTQWTERLRHEVGDGFPEKVTAFREGMAVHGRYRQPCPVCDSPVQRIRYAENEVNYCATCQTGGRVLADRALSRLLREDWPRSLDDWTERIGGDDDRGR